VAHTPDGKTLHLREVGAVDPIPYNNGFLSSEPGWATLNKAEKLIAIRCAGGTVLGLTKVKPEGKPDRWATEFWHGLRGVKNHAKQVFFGYIPKQSWPHT
jgi:methionyl-tRNA formyltransferase